MAKQEKGAVQLSEHAKKYDRQMRLWGAHGQQLLEEGKICMLGSNVAASEILKNCVLPAVGIFTIIDDADVSISDLGNNFFVTQDDVGKKRAEVVSEWLLEMNPDVSGSALIKNPSQLIADDISYFKQFNIVVSTQMYGDANRKLAAFCWQNEIPFLSVKVNGLMAMLRAQYPEICIMESHPSNDRTDLFIYPEQLKLFPELQAFIDSFDIDTTDVEKHAHLPCLAILGQFTQRYLKQHENKLPSTYKEQTEFKDKVSEMGNGENYMDAIHWASQCYLPPRIDREVQAVLKDEKALTIDAQSRDFWILVRGLNDFLANEGGGFLPCSTSIPDMTMDSKSYVALKAIYKTRAERDLKLIAGYVQKRLTSIGRAADSIASDLVERFVRNARSLKVVRTKSMAQEYENANADEYDELYMDMSAFEEKDDDEAEQPFKPLAVNWYWAFRAMEVFYDTEKRLPGDVDENVSGDVEKLVAIQTELYKTNKVPDDQSVVKECLEEMVRYGGAELHNMGAFVGGVASQTIMKVLLRQFYTYNHTYVFNGIHCDGQVIAL
eukprot:CAMPEP_0202726442 /NCGR_PEP_ID=MMETSP1385-20130828/184615_1 /ASSEMBLY_ACC=CAM_ASM_000861 /TAXON_ID=933848 /ORGANISM="Elphidium margaritaceum" /LENGTH=550 /DNA_ID=CAMNT_0049392663 /DNA_START=68 /DNA_END=1723 /DNA_ORIENTATION=+